LFDIFESMSVEDEVGEEFEAFWRIKETFDAVDVDFDFM
jgi:hypothetical protein